MRSTAEQGAGRRSDHLPCQTRGREWNEVERTCMICSSILRIDRPHTARTTPVRPHRARHPIGHGDATVQSPSAGTCCWKPSKRGGLWWCDHSTGSLTCRYGRPILVTPGWLTTRQSTSASLPCRDGSASYADWSEGLASRTVLLDLAVRRGRAMPCDLTHFRSARISRSGGCITDRA